MIFPDLAGYDVPFADDFHHHFSFRRFYAKPEWTDQGLMIGAETCLLPPGAAADDETGPRLLAVLSAATGRSLAKGTLGHIESARQDWQRGDAAMAHIRLAFATLPEVSQAGAYRAFLADGILAAGVDPDVLRRYVGLDKPERITKFDENQPRVPAGSGRESGRWASKTPSTVPERAETLITNIASTTTNLDYACRVLKIDPIEAGDALHAAKDAAGLGGADNCTFDLKTGDIFFNGEHIGNLRD